VNTLTALLLTAAHGAPAAQPGSPGKWVFVGALALLLVWLLAMPRGLIGQEEGPPPWWRNVRVWAVVVCTIQMLVYMVFA
jgi:hypothetical protein